MQIRTALKFERERVQVFLCSHATLTLRKGKSKMGIDMNSTGKLPISGSYLKVGFNKFLLFNNIRYKEKDTVKPRDYHFP